MTTQPLSIIGNEASPYSRKMRAVLRYRNIPHRWVVQRGAEHITPPPVPVAVIPVLVWHDEDGQMRESMVDSTPQIHRLEAEYSGRSLQNPSAALAFIDALIEDYADEWCTKLMFYYRWSDAEGAAWAPRYLMQQINPSMAEPQLAQFAAWFSKRQIDRRVVVGAQSETALLWQANYLRLLALLDAIIRERPFLFGHRPSAADFGLYGQLTQLCGLDPASSRIAKARFPRVSAWVERLEDLSGWNCADNQWLAPDAAIEALMPLLAEIAATYIPFLLANAEAKNQGQAVLVCAVTGGTITQPPFGYQVKCLNWLREQYARLPTADQAWLSPILKSSHCERLLV